MVIYSYVIWSLCPVLLIDWLESVCYARIFISQKCLSRKRVLHHIHWHDSLKIRLGWDNLISPSLDRANYAISYPLTIFLRNLPHFHQRVLRKLNINRSTCNLFSPSTSMLLLMTKLVLDTKSTALLLTWRYSTYLKVKLAVFAIAGTNTAAIQSVFFIAWHSVTGFPALNTWLRTLNSDYGIRFRPSCRHMYNTVCLVLLEMCICSSVRFLRMRDVTKSSEPELVKWFKLNPCFRT